jgi:TP901 family phage tail tape measure protein
VADDVKVYKIRYDTSQAINEIDRLDKKLEDFEDRISKFATRASSSISKAFAKSSRMSDKRLRRLSKSTEVAIGELNRIGKSGKSAGDKIAKGAAKAERGIRQVGTASKSAGASIGGMALKIGAFIGAAQGLRSITENFLEFDQSMTLAGAKFSKLEPQMTPGTKAFKEFRKEIREATGDMEHSASAVAGAVDFWAKAGKTSEQTKAVIPTTLNFASANTNAAGAMLGMAEAGDILSDTLGQFGLDTADPTQLMANTARVSDVMSSAANTANVSAAELFESFKTAGPVLTAVGGNIEETSALLATMANAGLKGSVAGRSLKIATAAINAPTKAQTKLYEKYNIVTQDSHGNMLKLTEIIGQLDTATSGLGTGERFGVFAQMFGRQGVTGFLNLLAKGEGELGKMAEALRNAGGETKRLAEITRTSATAQMQKFWNKVSNLGFTIIEETDLFGKLGKAVDGIDWTAAANFVINDVVPALTTVGRIIRNVVFPALKMTGEHLKTILSPALSIIEALFGSVGESGEGLAKVLSYLGTLWVAYRGYLMAIKAIGMIQWFTSLTASIVGAGKAQATLNTNTQATNASLKGSVKQFGLLNSAMAVVAAGVAGWTIGTVIHDQLIEPLAKATDTLQKLKLEIEDTEAKGLEGRTAGLLEVDVETADKALKLEKEQQATLDIAQSLTGMGGMGGMGAGLGLGPERKADTEKIEDFKKRAQEQLAIRRTEENIRRFEIGAEAEIPVAPQSIAPSVLDLPDRFGFGAGLDMGEGEILPEQGVSTVDVNLGTEMARIDSDMVRMEEKLDNLAATPVPQELEGQFAQFSPLADVSMDMLVSGQEEQRKLDEQVAMETRAFQSAMLAANTQPNQARNVENTFEIGPTTITIPVQSGDPEQLARTVKRALDNRDRQHRASLADAARATGPAEI